ncbi:MAG: right-handed parallel beta-helix repeat-containing protein [Candidatus Thermoplasmatota archaeon]|nr:right-handed parallel beta-helix repeat-containing protein [Candidatus Thermoplasmatota archaeon]
MKGKWVTIGIILLFFFSSISSTTGYDSEKPQKMLQGNWLYVGGSGPGNYTSIQEAIHNAHNGDTVFVFSGTYYEHSITISQKIHLLGEDRNTTLIDGQSSYNIGIKPGSGVSVSGFTIQRFTKYDTTIGPGTGIYLDGNDIVISDNIITWCTQGIFTKDNSYQIEISNNVFLQNQYYGLYLQCAACSIHDNYFISNREFALDVMGGTREVSIDHNHFEGNDVSIWIRSSRVNISRNNFIDNEEDIMLRWEATLFALPFVLYRTPIFNQNYWDDWGTGEPRQIDGYFVLWVSTPYWSVPVFSYPIKQFDEHPAQEPYNIGGR